MDITTIEFKIARGENLPVLPQVVSAVFKIADDPKCTAADLERLIQQDAALTAKILKVVNSPLYGVGNVGTVGRALTVLGTSRVRSLITSIALQNLVAERQQANRFNKIEFWRHSLAVATAARIIAKLRSPSKAEEMYVAGIMHDIGLLLMDKFCPDQLDTVIHYAECEGVPMHQAEQNVLHFTHADLGGILARRWSIGEFLANAVEHHHDGVMSTKGDNAGAVLEVADAIAHNTGFTNQLPSVQYELSEEMLSGLGLTCETIQTIGESMCEEFSNTEQTLGLATPPIRLSASGPQERLARHIQRSAY